MKLPTVHPSAWDDFEAIIRYLADEAGADIALSFENCVFYYLGEIQREPLMHHVRRFEVRRVNLRPRFREYYIAYMLWQGKVVVLAIAHAKRRPFYFRARIKSARRMF
ncbi:MAG TPA: type II toxin-antitoxin system RelE/ParE family toxin [Verrucomicrobiales bacterium]|nr:type II toxin-antitoxin system RelE/ParE family toxin [Verrucomicrobiales bacterium]